MPYTNPYAQSFVPTNGSTVTIRGFDGPLLSVLINPAGLLAILNIVFPKASDGQQVAISSTQAITLLGMTSSASIGGVSVSITGALTTLLLGGSATYAYYEAVKMWRRIQ